MEVVTQTYKMRRPRVLSSFLCFFIRHDTATTRAERTRFELIGALANSFNSFVKRGSSIFLDMNLLRPFRSYINLTLLIHALHVLSPPGN